MNKTPSKSAESPSELIDARIEGLGDWRGEMLSRIRALIKEAVPEVAEEWKWRGTPVWSHNGMICTGENPGAIRARGAAAAHERGRVPACIVSAAHRPNLTTAVSEKRRRVAGGINGAQQKEVP